MDLDQCTTRSITSSENESATAVRKDSAFKLSAETDTNAHGQEMHGQIM